MFDLTGKKALVTGSSQGIGFEIAKTLAKHGAAVFAHGSRPSEKLGKAAQLIGAQKAVSADLTDSKAAESLYSQTGDVDILVLNASVQLKKPWDEYTEEEYDKHFDCNLKSTYMIIKKYAPYMKKNGWGRIVTLGSVNQYNNHPQLVLYGVTKAAQKKLVESIAPSLAPCGVTVNNIAPGAIETPRNDAALADCEFRKKVESSIPAGYVGSPDDMNGAALLLCSDEGRYITGSEIIVDGGMHL
mgnify:FL=1